MAVVSPAAKLWSMNPDSESDSSASNRWPLCDGDNSHELTRGWGDSQQDQSRGKLMVRELPAAADRPARWPYGVDVFGMCTDIKVTTPSMALNQCAVFSG